MRPGELCDPLETLGEKVAARKVAESVRHVPQYTARTEGRRKKALLSPVETGRG